MKRQDFVHLNVHSHYSILNGCSTIQQIVDFAIKNRITEKNATVTICHSHTKDIASITREADILVAAVGHANYVTADMVKEGATVIDVGINRVDGKTVGDVDYEAVAAKAGAITPVPGGVGSVTTTMVIENIIAAGEKLAK